MIATRFAPLEPTSPKSAREQIRDQVRELIFSGKLAPEASFPSTRELARFWQTHIPTVHHALMPLVQEGLLVRHHGKGTFVRRPSRRLHCVGLYQVADLPGDPSTTFQRSLLTELYRLLAGAGLEADVWVDPRSVREQGRRWEPLVRAARDRVFQGLIVLPTDWRHIEWLQRLAVPTVYHTAANLPNRVDVSRRQLVELSLTRLARQGCRSVGLISPLSTAEDPQGKPNAYLSFFDDFMAIAGDLQLEVRNEWMRLPRHPGGPGNLTYAEFGYQQFRQLWALREKPDGLLAEPDIIAQGVVMGVVEQRVRVPQQLKLVLGKNRHVDYLCPMPATLVETDERDLAGALIEQIKTLARGQTCQPIYVLSRLRSAAGGATT